MIRMASPEAQNLLQRWKTEEDFEIRDEILERLQELKVFPGDDEDEWEKNGFYPDYVDPIFIPKLMRKREFQESKQESIKESFESGEDRCRQTEDFELSPVQTFVSRLLSPRTPYNSALLYHGVGVGKTCAAITIAESYLQVNPGKKVFIIAPPNIQKGFLRTIFDRENLKMGQAGEANSHRGCTGDIYLNITNTLFEKNQETIEKKIKKAIDSRYEFFGYLSLYNHIRKLINKIPKNVSDYELRKSQVLREEFSNRVMIVDEAHNLRDVPDESEEDKADDSSVLVTQDSKAGKLLTSVLPEVLEVSDGLTFVLMTATPMYNSYKEIIFMMNLLLMNDKFEKLKMSDIFDTKRNVFLPGGEKILGKVASYYISFMRGENPLTFPIRLEPHDENRIQTWPTYSAKKVSEEIPEKDRKNCLRLPCISSYLQEDVEKQYKEFTDFVAETKGLTITSKDQLVQAGNWIFPGDLNESLVERIGSRGFDAVFTKEKRGSKMHFSVREEIDAKWLLHENLPMASGKANVLLERLKNCKGVAFVYSRFVGSGALTISLALEANGYTLYGREGYLLNGNQHPEGRQCAMCPSHEKNHKSTVSDHKFTPAYYIFLTGSVELSANNNELINAARKRANKDGSQIKVILGSQIAGEGLDLRYVREVFVYDSWYHLNKLEQIVGRGIRTCSHAELPPEKRNCTVSLLVNSYKNYDKETVDMLSYREALEKAKIVGNVVRVLKQYAIDCNLNREAIIVQGLNPIPMILDSQGEKRFDVNINDTPLTPMCDWLETCDYECSVPVESLAIEDQDISTYDEYTAKNQMSKIKKFIHTFIKENQPFVTFDTIEKNFRMIPRQLLVSLMNDVAQERFEVENGRIIYKNGYYLYQPNKLKDTSIPIALRLTDIPYPKDFYKSRPIIIARIEKEELDLEEDTSKLWFEVMKWCKTIQTRADSKIQVVPDEITKEIMKLMIAKGVEKSYNECLEMIVWVQNAIISEGGLEVQNLLNLYSSVVMEYFWDNYITIKTKCSMITHESVRNFATDMFWPIEGKMVVRILNSVTNEIEYSFLEEEDKVRALTESEANLLKSDYKSVDPLVRRPISFSSTGFTYGFLIWSYKRNHFVFKHGEPPKAGKPLKRGLECANAGNVKADLIRLGKFGLALKNSNFFDFGMNEIYVARYKPVNSNRICTLSELILRLMDKLGVENKRWFYRPLEALLLGQKPTLEPTKKEKGVTKKAAAGKKGSKAEKEAEAEAEAEGEEEEEET